MTRFLTMALQGYGSFKRDTVFRFPHGPGLHLLTGRNEVEPRLGSNGAGKSTLWGGLCWVLFGKNPRGLKAGDVSNWDDDHLTSGVVELERDKRFFAIHRTWNPNSLAVTIGDRGEDPKPATQQQVDELLGFDYGTFLHVALIGQFGSVFFDLSPTAKLDVFNQVLKLWVWVEASKVARERASNRKGQLEEIERSLSEVRGSRRAVKDSLATLVEESERFGADRDRKLKALRDEYAKIQKDLQPVLAKLTAADGKAGSDRAALEAIERKLSKRAKRENELREQLAKCEADLNHAEAEIEKITGRITEVRSLKGSCPTCGQRVHKHHAESVLKTLRLSRKFEASFRDKIEDKHASLHNELHTLRGQIKTLLGERDEVTRDGEKRRNKVSSLKADASKLRSVLDRTSESIKALEAGGDPHAKALASARASLRTMKEKIVKLKRDRETLIVSLDQQEFWVKEFKHVRLWVMETALAELEIEVNNSLIELGLEGWSVTFDVERETTGGTVTRGFVVNIESPTSGKPVRWEAWSGGETDRLRVASALGLSSLVRGRTGIDLDFEAWDEPTRYLSEEGINSLLEFFEHRSRSLRRQVWLVDHRSLNFGGFDSRAVVVKTKDGSTVRQ